MHSMIDFLVGLLGNLLAGELAAWGPRLADKIISYSVRKLPPELEARMLEEWRALLADTPGDFAKVMTAISLFLSRNRIRDELQVERPRVSPSPHLHTLSPREVTILNWISNGKTNWEISMILGVTERTVRFHISSIFSKLDVTSRTRAVATAMELTTWEKKYSPIAVSELRRLRQLEEENGQLKRLVADLSFDKDMLSKALRKESLKPARRRELAQWFRETFYKSWD